MNLSKMKKKDTYIFNVKLSSLNYQEICRQIDIWIKNKQKKYICVAAVHLVMECQDDEKLRQGVNQAGIVTTDGMPLVWFSKIHGQKSERIYGPELMLKICRLAEKRSYRLYFLGGSKGQSLYLKQKLTKKFPQIKIVGYKDTPFKKITKKDNKGIIKDINNKKAQIVFVGIGCPVQEQWMFDNSKFVNANVLIGVGAAFDFICGYKKQAPKWMQKNGLEWLFRLFQEPRRLFYRYTILNTRFTFIAVKEIFMFFLKKIIFYQPRIGKNGREFTMYKFRTMYKGADKDQKKYQKLNEADGPVFKIYNDPRYTKLGKFLAHTGLDELPQIINVLKGEMAIVGPRPLPTGEAVKLKKWQKKREKVLPGITSPWIVNGHHKIAFDDWMKSDLWYVENKSFFLDLQIIWQTFWMIIKLFAKNCLEKL